VAGKSTTLTVRIVSDAKDAAKGFDAAESKTAKFQSGLDKASVAAGGLLLGLGAVAKEAFDAASSMQQSSGAVESVFGDQARAVQDLAKKAARANGLSANSYQELASVIGSQLKNMGTAHDELAPKTDQLIDLGSDLAATFGGTAADAVSALSSLLRGERDPIEQYGITITQAGLDAKVAAMGLDTSTEAAKRASEAEATMALAFEQASGAIGATARESDTAAGSMATATAAFDNAKAALGDRLLPIVTDAALALEDFLTWVEDNQGAAETFAIAIGGLATAILVVNAATKAYAAGAAIAAAAQWVLNAAMTANPIGLVVVGIGALIAAVILAYNKFKWFRDIVDSVWSALKKAWDWAGKVAGAIGDWAGNLFGAPMAVQVTPVATDTAAGLFGAADESGAWAPIRGAAMSPSSGGTSPSAGRGAAPVVNITVTGALDPQAVADQIAALLRRRDVAQGLTPVVAL
jgi:phage-related protein